MEFLLNDKEMYQFFDNLANGIMDNTVFENAYNYLKDTRDSSYIFDCNAEINIAKFYRKLALIYSDQSAKEQACVVDNLQKIFRRFICINGLERLLATNYTDIEWSMFLEYDFEKEDSKYYRDHFVHQFRDAFLSICLLSTNGFTEALTSWYKDQDSQIAVYIKDCLGNLPIHDEQVHKFFSIVYKSILLSSVFHDLGYPLSHFARVSEQIDNSLSFHNLIFQTQKTNFQQIQSILASSLLFRSVHTKEIEQKYKENDHGALSAICFLLNFYNTGEINILNSEKRCIIELSARAIYDHTNKFKSPARITFQHNPISYILRISDDLQEWSRFYISLDTNNNAMIEPKSMIGIYSDDGRVYKKATGGSPCSFIKTTFISYKKLNFIDSCGYILMEEKEGIIFISIDYNRYALLEISTINFTYALYRHKELFKLTRLFANQLHLPPIKIEYFLSNNVFFLAREILRDFIKLLCDTKFQMHLEQADKPIIINVHVLSDKCEKLLNTLERNRALFKYIDSRFLYYTLDDSLGGEIKEESGVHLTTREYSEYIISSKNFLKKNIGLLGLLNYLTQRYKN